MTRIRREVVDKEKFQNQMQKRGWIFNSEKQKFLKTFYSNKTRYMIVVETINAPYENHCWEISDLKFYVWQRGRWKGLAREPAVLRGKIRRYLRKIVDESLCK